MGGKKKAKKGGKKRPSKAQNVKAVLADFFKSNSESYSYRQILKLLGIRDMHSKEAIKDLLFSMESKGIVSRNREGKWEGKIAPEEYTGVLDHVNARFAYVVVEGLEEDIWVKKENLNYAVDGDEVLVRITKSRGTKGRAEGRIVAIKNRARLELVGKIDFSEKYAFVTPDGRNLHFDVFLFPEKTRKAKQNDKVIVKITKWHNAENRNPSGEVVRVLGQAGENNAEIHSIMAEFGLPFEFPKNIETAAKKIPEVIDEEKESYRRDMRSTTTFTIDPEDAKDFDDAISIERLKNGNWEIGVHIADVANYIKEGSILDKEAYERATSVYLVDRTIPMLPEKLSNGVCSLRPKEDKLTFSAVFELNELGDIKSKWFGRTITHSDRRFTYEDAQAVLDNDLGDFLEELKVLNFTAKSLKKKRFDQGAVNFETVEVKFDLDEKGKPLAVIPKVRKDTHKLVEEFMLLANREVATYVNGMKFGRSKESPTFVYRTHDDPNSEKLQNLAGFAAKFGHKLNLNGNLVKNLNMLLTEIEGKPEQNVLESVAIRSMAKAKYTTSDTGHFGLAFDHYTHFTSPIRRYPDVMVHRLLWDYLSGNNPPEGDPIEKQCLHTSEREKRASDAERASIKYKQVEFMSERVGDELDGIVSGVTEWGVFVELSDTKCEGMVRISDLDDDFYEYDERNYRVIGKRSKRIITLGDNLTVQVVRTDVDRRTIDLRLIDKNKD